MNTNLHREAPIQDAEHIVHAILEDYRLERHIDRKDDFYEMPSKEVVIDIINKLMKIIYPGYFRDRTYKSYNAGNHLATLIEDVMYRLHAQIIKVAKFAPGHENVCKEKIEHDAYRITVEFLNRIPQIRAYLEEDLEAALEGDPAARNYDEVILSYPGLYAITVNRLAHELFLLKVPLIPRIMTEHAHSLTGIDIHPGAAIGHHFFIDHGTGIVVGETTVIGDNVKIYQGVTLGALSTRGGQKLRDVRRHPTIEDNVTIYAGASILGGDTVIGHDSVIGSNAFITKSIPAGTRVSIRQQELQFSGNFKMSENDLTDDTWFYII
ncbi:MAG: serine acetyltransferase [Lachnospiraceae bacterium]|nr:serine acetyltransferase [Lachnospiraceae bacterium]